MGNSVEDCVNFAREIVKFYPRICSAADVISESNVLAKDFLNINEVIKSEKGHSIQLLSQDVSNRKNILFYGFPDPGEAVGGTVLLCLMKALKMSHPFIMNLEISWNFIPCLNLDDQPNFGKTLDKVMKTGAQEVDWLVQNPRPETKALMELAEKLQPHIVFPLHDEWHCHERIPCYMPVSRSLNQAVTNGLRKLLKSFGLAISQDVIDSDMGAGFLDMTKVDDFKNSTFFEFSKHGLVFICEVPDLPNTSESEIIAAQLAASLFIISNTN